jgi:large subunit ribosomal protein L20
MEAVDKALQHAYKGRKLKKRDFRGLWQTRISAAAKTNETSYSALIGSLKKKNAIINRKMLSEVALNHPSDFKAIVEWSKTA